MVPMFTCGCVRSNFSFMMTLHTHASTMNRPVDQRPPATWIAAGISTTVLPELMRQSTRARQHDRDRVRPKSQLRSSLLSTSLPLDLQRAFKDNSNPHAPAV